MECFHKAAAELAERFQLDETDTRRRESGEKP